MHLESYGPADGTPVVFLHGAMVGGWMWLGQVEDLPAYRCLVPDLPGMDRSGDEPWLGMAATADAVAEAIGAHGAGGSAHVVGLSLGAIVGLHVAARHPARVRSLLVSGVPYGDIPAPLRLLSRVMLELYRRPRGARLVARLFGIPDDESLTAFLATARRTDPAALRAVTAEVNRSPLPADLGAIEAPTLAVVGAKDTAPARRAVPNLARAIPGAIGRTVPGVGHQWNAEDRALFSAVVQAWVDERRVHDRLVAIPDEPGREPIVDLPGPPDR